MSKRNQPADYHKLAETRGFKWIGPEKSLTTRTKTTWQCKEGHQWQATYPNIKGGTSCVACSGKRKTPADYHALAKSRGFKWLGPEVLSTKAKTGWQCDKGHRWESIYSSIKSDNSSCPGCSKSGPKFKVKDSVCSGLNLPAADLELLKAEYGSGWQSVARRILASHVAMLRKKRRRASLVIDISYISEYPGYGEDDFYASHWISADIALGFELYKHDESIQNNNDLDKVLESAGVYSGLDIKSDSEASCSYWYFGDRADAVKFVGRLSEFIEGLRTKK